MLKERRLAADLVTAHFLTAEKAADLATSSTAACLAKMLEQRAAANLPLGMGTEALRLVSEATGDLMRARQKLIDAHSALLEVRSDMGLRAYGDQSECPPDVVGPMARSATPIALVA
ncbi:MULTISPECIES: hypothetical protein [unclassified Sphingomonas]|uniref:hypothetical protein n=1 Tax=unclassified Sphingomonas TaxID=196159 RepID=UPI00226A6511|nr:MULTISPECIES: hypothetical protein [unclassified Sphingomonas]